MGYNMAVGQRTREQFKTGWVFCGTYTEALAYIDKYGKPDKIDVHKTKSGNAADYKKLNDILKKKPVVDDVDVEKER